MLKTKIAKAIATVAKSMAKAACGTASHFGSHQFKEPAKLDEMKK